MKILFDAATLNLRVMLRHEASATDETNASFIQMPEVKKIVMKSGIIVTKNVLVLLFKKQLQMIL